MALSLRAVSACLIGLILHKAVADDMSMLKADDECEADDAQCALNALQAKAHVAKADVDSRSYYTSENNGTSSSEVYPANYHWNCYDGGKSSQHGYEGQMSVSSCRRLCDQTSWCVGFQYMSSDCGHYQDKCWLREGGLTCSKSTSGEQACFTYYGSFSMGPHAEMKTMEAHSGYELVGHGDCVDANGHTFEHWNGGQPQSLYFAGHDASKCGCPDCADICNRYPDCLGYSFNCCPEGKRCIAAAQILFSRGNRPAGPAPTGFSTHGYYNSPTSGSDFPGVGQIMRVDHEDWDSEQGGSKCFRRK